MLSLPLTAVSPDLASLLKVDVPNDLGPGTPDAEMLERLREMDDRVLFGEATVVDREMADCCRSALWLLHDFLEESHRISQEIGSPTGSYWHGIMHRREPDFSNAKYWYRRAGVHPIHDELADTARREARRANAAGDAAFLVEEGPWNPAGFVDLCAKAVEGDGRWEDLCRYIALREWELLFTFCYRRACGQPPTA